MEGVEAGMAVARQLPLTVGILAKNEAEDLPGCLAQVRFAREVVVLVDEASADGTEAIARAAGARVLRQPLRSFAAARNTILGAASNDWVLFLDADERLTPELTASITATVRKDACQGAELLRQDVFLGKRLRHGDASGWFLRLGTKTAGRWERPVHEVWRIDGSVIQLDGVLLHYAHKSVAEYLKKMEFYTDLDAQSSEPSAGFWQFLVYPIAKFFKVYFLQGGILDGWPGLVFALLNARYSYTKRLKLYRAARRA